MTLRILIVEDHTLVSQGLEVMLSLTNDLELVAVVDNGEEAVARVKKDPVDVVLMDVNLGHGMSGIDAAREIKRSSASTKVMILSMFTDPATVVDAVKAGVDGYLSKGASRDALVAGIRDVARGKSVLDPNVTDGIFEQIGGRFAGALSEKELAVLQHLADGLSTKEVADRIFISEETVKSHLKQIFKKLDVRDRTEAVAEGFRRGLLH